MCPPKAGCGTDAGAARYAGGATYCGATGVGAVSLGAAVLSYDQPRVDALLGVDGEDEFALYVACVGKPKADEK